MRKMFMSGLLFLGMISPSVSAEDTQYKPREFSNLEFTLDYNTTLSLSGMNVVVSFYYQTNAYRSLSSGVPRTMVSSTIKDSWPIMQGFLSDNGIPTSDCRGNRYNVNFFFVTAEEMYNASRWNHYTRTSSNARDIPIYGYYDATHGIMYNSAIIIRDSGLEETRITVAHEMAHYWWDRLCISRHYSAEPESFARSFERRYWRILR